tara:strand:+ start:40 stop:255 length:216 start_codon:yes stop_codon:yes gene_type:complete
VPPVSKCFLNNSPVAFELAPESIFNVIIPMIEPTLRINLIALAPNLANPKSVKAVMIALPYVSFNNIIDLA